KQRNPPDYNSLGGFPLSESVAEQVQVHDRHDLLVVEDCGLPYGRHVRSPDRTVRQCPVDQARAVRSLLSAELVPTQRQLGGLADGLANLAAPVRTLEVDVEVRAGEDARGGQAESQPLAPSLQGVLVCLDRTAYV